MGELEIATALEEFGVLRVGAGPAALDEGHPEAVEPLGDAQLVVAAERDPLALGSVAQGGVVELDVNGWLHTPRSRAGGREGSRARRLPRAGSGGRTGRPRS